jgi:ABC-type amino acid transport system permease subunit
MSTFTIDDPRTLWSKWIFAFAYPVAFIGALFLGVSETFGFVPSSVINEKLVVFINVIIGLSGLVSIFNWFNASIPFFGDAIINRQYIKPSSSS